jgi:hypothetical protein
MSWLLFFLSKSEAKALLEVLGAVARALQHLLGPDDK